MKNVFLQDSKFGEDVPSINVPKDAAQFDFFLQQQLVSKFSNLYGRSMEVKYSRPAEEGNSYGAIVVKLSGREEDENQITFPFIVKDYKMFPFDVFEFKGKFNKATPPNIDSVLSSEAVNFATPNERKRNTGLIDTALGSRDGMEIMDPGNVFSGKTVMAAQDFKDVEKVAEVKNYLSLITKSIPDYAVKLANNPGAFAGFKEFVKRAEAFMSGVSPKLRTLCKAAKLKYSPETCEYTFDYAFINTKSNKVELATKTAGTLKDIVTEIQDIADPSPFVEKMRSDNEAVDSESIDNDAQILSLSESDDVSYSPEQSYVLYSNGGKPYVGAVIPNVVDFDLNRLPSQLFIGTEPIGAYAFDEKLDIKTVPGKDVPWAALKSPIEQNMTVSFLIPGPNTDKPVAATFPFKVLSVKSVAGDVAYVGKFLLRNSLMTLIPTETVKTPVKVAPQDLGNYSALADMTTEIYLVPKKLSAVSLDSAIETTNIKEGERRFISNQVLTNRAKVAQIVPWGKGDYKVIHPDITFAGNGQLALAALGASHVHEKVAQRLKQDPRSEITVLLPNYASPNFKAVTKVANAARLDKNTLIKIAAGINDEGMAMLSLSLGLIDTDDGMRFGDYITTFSDTIDKLIKLLLASRMGMSMSESASIKLGIDTLDSLIQQLRMR